VEVRRERSGWEVRRRREVSQRKSRAYFRLVLLKPSGVVSPRMVFELIVSVGPFEDIAILLMICSGCLFTLALDSG